MIRTRTRAVALAVVTTLLVSGAGVAHALTDTARSRSAAAFIADKQSPNGSLVSFSSVGSTADAVLAFVAVGRGEQELAAALAYLRRQARGTGVTSIGLKAKVALAVEAAGGNAHRFGGRDLIAELLGAQSVHGRFKGAAVLDQALALLAIQAADGLPNGAGADWLRNAQCPDGGWAYDAPWAGTDRDDCSSGPGDFYTSDTNTTAYAVMALVAWDAPVHDVFGYFDANRDATYGGWGYTTGYSTTDANSTALVIQAYLATGATPPDGSFPALRALQYRCGAFAYSYDEAGKRTGRNLGATIGAVPALRKLAFPYTADVAGRLPASDCG